MTTYVELPHTQSHTQKPTPLALPVYNNTVRNGEPVNYFSTNDAYAEPAYANPSGPSGPSGYMPVQTSGYMQPAQTPAVYDVEGNPLPLPVQGGEKFANVPLGATVYVQTCNVNPNVVYGSGLSSLAFVCFILGWCFPVAWYIGICDIKNENPKVRVWAYVDAFLATLLTMGFIVLIVGLALSFETIQHLQQSGNVIN